MIKKYNKLVRDRIPEIITVDNEIPKIKILKNKEFVDELLKKLHEETKEAMVAVKNTDKEGLAKEIGDLYEIIDSLIENFSLDRNEILKLQNERREKRGGFKEKIFLIETETK